MLEPRTDTQEAALQRRTFVQTNGLRIETSYYWPKPPAQGEAGYTAPLVSFVETRIAGLTTQPIVLTNFFSQTYSPSHHNLFEDFLFEPRLEPGLDASILAELEAANIRVVYIRILSPYYDLFSARRSAFNGAPAASATCQALGFDGKMREL